MTTHSNILAWRIPMDRGAWCTFSVLNAKEKGKKQEHHAGSLNPQC